MAIDTESKRRSVQAYSLGLMRPVPNNAISAADRATLAWLYSGLFSDDETASGAAQGGVVMICSVGRLMHH